MSEFRVTGPGRYELRNEDVVVVGIIRTDVVGYPVIASDGSQCWAMDGRFSLLCFEHPLDIVRRLNDDPVAATPSLLEQFAAWGHSHNPSLILRDGLWRLEYHVEDSLTMICSGPVLADVLSKAMEEE